MGLASNQDVTVSTKSKGVSTTYIHIGRGGGEVILYESAYSSFQKAYKVGWVRETGVWTFVNTS